MRLCPKQITDFIHQFCCQKNGEPITLLKWQTDLIREIYGRVDEQGKRITRNVFCLLPRRNGKSTFLATLLVAHLVMDEPASECYVLSNTVAQTDDSIFAACKAIVANSPALQRRLKVLKSRGRIVNLKNNSRLQVLTSTQHGLLGKDAQILAYDECCWFKDRRLVTNLRGSQLNRAEPLAFYISTASDNLEGIGHELYRYSCSVRDGQIVDPTWLPVLYEASPKDDWTDPALWRNCNPSMGVLFQESDLAKLCKEAQTSPVKEAEFKMFHLNLWQFSAIAWLSRTTWMDCAGELPDLAGRKCYVGLDLARVHDCAAVVFVFPVGDKFCLVPHVFLPADNIKEKSLQDHAPYQQWAEQGFLTLTPGNVIDYGYIRKTLQEDKAKYKIEQVGFDPYNATHLVQQLMDEDNLECVEVRQTMPSMAPATSQFEKLLKEKRIVHPNHPVFNWHAGNVSVRSDVNANIMPDKLRSRSRFDLVQAAIIGLSRALAAQDLAPFVMEL